MRTVSLLPGVCVAFILMGCEQQQAVVPKPPRALKHRDKVYTPADYFQNRQVLDLCAAIGAQDVQQIEHLARQGVDVNARGKHNCTPLQWAFCCAKRDNSMAAFKALLRLGADPNVLTTDYVYFGDCQFTIGTLVHAVTVARPGEYFDCVMESGGKTSVFDSRSFSPLHVLANGAFVLERAEAVRRLDVLLAHGAEIDSRRSPSGKTPVVEAIEAGNIRFALELLRRGANPVLRGTIRQSVAHTVATAGVCRN